MYRILSEGKTIDFCNMPRYVKKSYQSGSYIEADKDDAEGIAVRGVLYNICGKNLIPGAPQAVIKKDEFPMCIYDNMQHGFDNEENIILVEDALCEMDAQNEAMIANIEQALCDLDVGINGGGQNE